MRFNIFRNNFIYSNVRAWQWEQRYAQLAKDKENDRRVHKEIIDLEYWNGYNNGYLDGYTDAEAHYEEWKKEQ
jgi:hypothetical protein